MKENEKSLFSNKEMKLKSLYFFKVFYSIKNGTRFSIQINKKIIKHQNLDHIA